MPLLFQYAIEFFAGPANVSAVTFYDERPLNKFRMLMHDGDVFILRQLLPFELFREHLLFFSHQLLSRNAQLFQYVANLVF